MTSPAPLGPLWAAVAAHPAAPGALLRAVADHIDLTERGRPAPVAALGSNPTLPADVLDTLLSRYAGRALTVRTSGGADLEDVLATLGDPALAAALPLLLALPDPHGQVATALLARGPSQSPARDSYAHSTPGTSRAQRDEMVRHMYAWAHAWATLLGRDHLPVAGRLEAARRLATHPDLPHALTCTIVDLVADHPDQAGSVHADAFDPDLRAAALRVVDGPRYTVPEALDVLHNNPHPGYVYQVVAGTGPGRVALAEQFTAAPGAPTDVLRTLAAWPTLPYPTRHAAAVRCGPRFRDSSAELATVVCDERASADLQIAYEHPRRWMHAGDLALARHPHPQTVDAFLDDVASRNVPPVPWQALLTYAAHPALTPERRGRAAQLLASGPPRDPQITTAAALAAAVVDGPGTAAAGCAIPVLALTHRAVVAALASSLDAALTQLLPRVADVTTATALVRLAPTFPGTLAELVTTARAVAS